MSSDSEKKISDKKMSDSKKSFDEYIIYRVWHTAKRLTEIVDEKKYFSLDDIDDEDIRSCIADILYMTRKVA